MWTGLLDLFKDGRLTTVELGFLYERLDRLVTFSSDGLDECK